ncbi:MAG: helix-turn-helix transcriptional regulator [Arenicella sp.]|nr:helix-turn-helix transcriptional regulator [Arenicella sp.]
MSEQLILNQAIADGLDVIGDRWTLLILRSAFYGVNRFDAFQAATGASRSTLSRRLNALIEHEIFYKHPYSNAANRFEYKFTEKGLGLFGPSLLAAKWEADWKTADYVDISDGLFHHHCNAFMRPKVVCRACKQNLFFDEVAWSELRRRLESQLEEIRTYNTQNRKRVKSASGPDLGNSNLASLIGDRWTLLVLIASFLGVQRYDAFLTQLNTPPSVLSERLKQLVSNKIFEKVEYQKNPPRHNYILTDKGKALFPFVMTLRQWVAGNLNYANESSPLTHSSCGKPLVIDIVCDQCDHKPWPADLEFRRRS